MSMSKTKLDATGRLYLPNKLRQLLRLEKGDILDIAVDRDSIIIHKGISVTDEGRGIFKVKRHIKDVDGELKRILRKKAKEWTT